MTSADGAAIAPTDAGVRFSIAPAPTEAEIAALTVALLALLETREDETPHVAEPTPWWVVARREAVFGRCGVAPGWGRRRSGGDR